MSIPHVDRDERDLTQEREHNVLRILHVYACFVRKAHDSEYTQPVLLFYTPTLLVSTQ